MVSSMEARYLCDGYGLIRCLQCVECKRLTDISNYKYAVIE